LAPDENVFRNSIEKKGKRKTNLICLKEKHSMRQDSQNPFKSIPAAKKQPRITLAVVNHAPIESGDFQLMRGVVCGRINSLNRNSEISFERMLFDTGSCKAVQLSFLKPQDAGSIQYYLLSENHLEREEQETLLFPLPPGNRCNHRLLISTNVIGTMRDDRIVQGQASNIDFLKGLSVGKVFMKKTSHKAHRKHAVIIKIPIIENMQWSTR
jgi:hypothetical protein